jgi:hypothetical protein
MKSNYSFPSTQNSRCKFCGGKPKYHFLIMNKMSSKNPRALIKQYDQAMKYVGVINCSELIAPKYIRGARILSYQLFHNKFDVKFHKNYKEINHGSFTDNVLACECASTTWRTKIIEKAPHIKNKAARFEYDDRFIDW